MVVEAAIVIPLMVSLCAGVLQFGLRLQQGLLVSNAARQGARIGAQQGDHLQADQRIIEAVRGASGSLSGKILTIVIYKADAAGAMSPTCRAMAGQGGFDGEDASCNIYRAENDFALPDTPWIPLTRSNDLEESRDDLGVWVQVAFDSPVGDLFDLGSTISDYAVFRIEPRV